MNTVLKDVISAPPLSSTTVARKAKIDVASLAPSRWATVLTFLCTDVAAFVSLGVLVSLVAGGGASVVTVLPVMGLLLIAYALFGLYNVVATHPAQELRKVSIVTTAVFAIYTVATALTGPSVSNETILLLLTWPAAVVLVLGFRGLGRVIGARLSWWGVPVVVIASEGAGEAVIRTLKRWPELGFKPVALLQQHPTQEEMDGVPVIGTTAQAPKIAARYDNIRCAIVAMPDLSYHEQVDALGRFSKFYQRVFVIPGLSQTIALWTGTRSFEGLMGYQVQHCDWKRQARIVKRTIDIVGATVILFLLAPLFAAIAVLIKLDSEGPVFFRQVRMGKDGRCFNLVKFRTMYVDAEDKLEEILRKNPELKTEYETFRKLREDPRVTRVGQVLRQYSLDELPQLWNVLLGDMSLVGPRAYMPEELSGMQGLERSILQNPPGLTGLWQVSGRNQLSFEERLNTDVHYIHNWTPWLDVYILARTIPVVLTGEGAC